jgi:poly-gamma-glutamate synthesis protein (capsule biosynthesis protein)
MASIIIGADFIPTQTNEMLFKSGEIEKLFGHELLSVLQDASLRVFNLELPLTRKKTPIKKCGPTLIGDPETLKSYQAISVDLFTLANNHIMDQGTDGLFNTIELLDKNHIRHIGAGKDLKSARETCVIEIYKKKIGFYACAEHEFSLASESTPGANPYDPLESFDHVSALAAECDFIIVLYHGGKEYYRYPSPQLQKTCRKFIEKGADLVVTQHSHCIGCKENYADGTIVYGQGNFLFDDDNNEFCQTGLLIKIVMSPFDISFIPIIKYNNAVRLAKGRKADEILSDFEKRSNMIKKQNVIENEYKEFALKSIDKYLLAAHGVGTKNIFFRILNKCTRRKLQKHVIERTYKLEEILKLQDYVECEAHRELFLSGLKALSSD